MNDANSLLLKSSIFRSVSSGAQFLKFALTQLSQVFALLTLMAINIFFSSDELFQCTYTSYVPYHIGMLQLESWANRILRKSSSKHWYRCHPYTFAFHAIIAQRRLYSVERARKIAKQNGIDAIKHTRYDRGALDVRLTTISLFNQTRYRRMSLELWH